MKPFIKLNCGMHFGQRDASESKECRKCTGGAMQPLPVDESIRRRLENAARNAELDRELFPGSGLW